MNQNDVPILLLDMDGVITPRPIGGQVAPQVSVKTVSGDTRIVSGQWVHCTQWPWWYVPSLDAEAFVNEEVVDYLNWLIQLSVVEPRWLTTWDTIAPSLRAFESAADFARAPWPLVRRGDDDRPQIYTKLLAVQDVADAHPDQQIIWVDDDADWTIRETIRRPNVSVIQPSPTIGLRVTDVYEILSFTGESGYLKVLSEYLTPSGAVDVHRILTGAGRQDKSHEVLELAKQLTHVDWCGGSTMWLEYPALDLAGTKDTVAVESVLDAALHPDLSVELRAIRKGRIMYLLENHELAIASSFTNSGLSIRVIDSE